ncbi:MAG: TIGR02302 family protein [Rhodobacteraceae bacterium]|nr:TIGR02302 family protein [Paracoccaceae bacterium]
MDDPSHAPAATDPKQRLAWPLRLTRLGLVAERVVRAFWPLWTVLLVVLAALLLGLHDILPLELVWTGLLAAVATALWAAVFAVRRFRWPSAAEAERRLDATLGEHPLTALADHQAIGAGDAASERVWQAHLNRMMERAQGARPVAPDLKLARFDRYGLRYVALTVFATALVFGSVLRLDSMSGIVAVPGRTVAAGPSWEGWIEPPAYTGRPSLYLNDLPAGPVEVPAGSRVELRLYGDAGELAVAETVSGRTGETGSASDTVQSFEVTQAGKIEVLGEGGAAWAIQLMPDAPPEVAVEGPPRRSAAGEMTQPYSAKDDFGVQSGRAVLHLDLDRVDRRYGLATAPEPRDDIEVALPMPITGGRTEFVESLVEDFSKHPWAGLPVTMTLEVVDAAGNVGTSEPEQLDALPGRRFFDPLAKALIEERRDLLWSRENAPRVAQLLRAVSHHPEDFFRVETDYMRLRFIARDLESSARSGLSQAKQDEIAEALWALAVQIEEGDLSDAMAQLRRAQERLSEAMKNGASQEEIADLMQDLREAMQNYMRQLAEQAQRSDEQRDLSDAQEITGQQLQDLLNRLQDLMEQGRMAEAQALLEQLNRLMENLQMAQNQGQGQQSPGQQALQGLQDSLRNQQQLSDDSFQGLQGQGGAQQSQRGQRGQGRSQADNQGGEGRDLGDQLADRQQALRNELQRQREQLPGMGEGTESARRSLDEAGRAMDNAEQALRENDLSGAMDSQAEAMDRLRDGIQSLGEDLAQQQMQGQGQQGDMMGQSGPNSRRDPLGRDTGGEGPVGTRNNLLQDDDVYRRARDLLEEIQRRSSDRTRPEQELDYLRRLLDRF